MVRCMPHLKRREADDAVSAGRVLVNGALVRPSRRVVHGDVVTLDVIVLLTSIRKVMALSFVIRVVASYRGMLDVAGKLLKFPVRRCKFLSLNVREIAATR